MIIYARSHGGEIYCTIKRDAQVRWSALSSVQRASEVIAKHLADHWRAGSHLTSTWGFTLWSRGGVPTRNKYTSEFC